MAACRPAGSASPSGLQTYAVTIGVAQVGWVALPLAHTTVGLFVVSAVVLFLVEMVGPVIAERGKGGTPWHAHERYGLDARATRDRCRL